MAMSVGELLPFALNVTPAYLIFIDGLSYHKPMTEWNPAANA